MLRLSLSAALVAMFATTASAQTTVITPNRGPMIPAPVAADQVRISVGVNTFMAAPVDNSAQALQAEENGRRMIYQLAAHECDILRDTIASECHLESINVNVQRVVANQNFYPQSKADGFNINGNINFRIVAK